MMQFNRYIFDCYLATQSGKETVAFFEGLPERINKAKTAELYAFLAKRSLKNDIEHIQESVDFASSILSEETMQPAENIKAAESIEAAIEDYEVFIDSFLDEENTDIRALLTWIEGISLFLYAADECYYFPYFLINRFFQLETIFQAFSIPLPALPTAKKYRERLSYYGELCRVVYDFRQTHQLSAAEFCAFLYDFAPNTVSEFIDNGNLPEAVNVYISGGNQYDKEAVDSSGVDYQTFWQGNPKTQVGDIVLLYSLAPYSAITGIFRAFSPGYYDPFSYYPNRIWVGAPIKIPPIKLADLKENAVWQQKGLVKANMQGVNGRQCNAEEYQALLLMLQQRGFPIEKLPQLMKFSLEYDRRPENERDVETMLLEPLLQRLGFKEKDWLRQMPLRMGRGHRMYPDYALFADVKKGEESAKFIWEAKYRIANQADLREAFFQAKSYALRLNCKGLGLVALEGVWAVSVDEQFALDKLRYFSWEMLSQADAFAELAKFCSEQQLNSR